MHCYLFRFGDADGYLCLIIILRLSKSFQFILTNARFFHAPKIVIQENKFELLYLIKWSVYLEGTLFSTMAEKNILFKFGR